VIGILDLLLLLTARCGSSPLLFAFLGLVLEGQGCIEKVQTPVETSARADCGRPFWKRNNVRTLQNDYELPLSTNCY
jgi:hypothetical protein